MRIAASGWLLRLVGFDQAFFDRIVEDYRAFATSIGITDFIAIPISGLKGDLSRAARIRHGRDPADIDGIYLLVHEGTQREQLLVDGAAGREIWPRVVTAAMPMRLMPVPLLDIGYRAFARVRYRLFGKADACVVPPPSIRARFLDGL